MADTLFFSGKRKRGRTALEVFEKMRKAVKKKGPTRDWVCTIDEENETFCIDFPDGKSESFVLEFDEKGNFSGFCKVYFPLEGDGFEEEKSEFKALIRILYAARTSFSKIEVSDDYELASEYWDSIKYKIKFRNLTDEEEKRVRNLYFAGCTRHEDMIMAILAEDMGMSVKELQEYSNPETALYDNRKDIMEISRMLDVCLYEAAAFEKKGRVCDISAGEYYDLGSLLFSVWAVVGGVEEMFFAEYKEHYLSNPNYKREARISKQAKIMWLFDKQFYPAYQKEKDKTEQCILAYRYFLSIFEYAGFTYVGRTDTPTIKERIWARYGDEKGESLIKYFCTWELHLKKMGQKGKEYLDEHLEHYLLELFVHMNETNGMEFIDEWRAFQKEYRYDAKMRDFLKREEAKDKKGLTSPYIDHGILQGKRYKE